MNGKRARIIKDWAFDNFKKVGVPYRRLYKQAKRHWNQYKALPAI